jgi:hypothetical protein
VLRSRLKASGLILWAYETMYILQIHIQ